jgi:hypothetical protein
MGWAYFLGASKFVRRIAIAIQQAAQMVYHISGRFLPKEMMLHLHVMGGVDSIIRIFHSSRERKDPLLFAPP